MDRGAIIGLDGKPAAGTRGGVSSAVRGWLDRYWCELQTVLPLHAGWKHKAFQLVCAEVMHCSNACTWVVEASWNVMSHAQKPDFDFRRNGRVHLNRRGRQFSRLLTAEVCASGAVMLDTPCSQVVRRVLPTHSIRQYPLHSPLPPLRASPCAITF
jgi:hypothetical protein